MSRGYKKSRKVTFYKNIRRREHWKKITDSNAKKEGGHRYKTLEHCAGQTVSHGTAEYKIFIARKTEPFVFCIPIDEKKTCLIKGDDSVMHTIAVFCFFQLPGAEFRSS